MFKKNCLALLSLGLFSSFANASAYSDKLAEMQAKFEQALKGDQAAAASRKLASAQSALD